MKKNIKENIINIISVFIVSIFFVFIIFPILINLEYTKTCLEKSNISFWVAITAIMLLIFIRTWEKSKIFWKRYKYTYCKSKIFIYPDFIIFFIIFSYLLIALFQDIPKTSIDLIHL